MSEEIIKSGDLELNWWQEKALTEDTAKSWCEAYTRARDQFSKLRTNFERLKKQDLLHWKTRRSQLKMIQFLTDENERLRGELLK